MQITTGSLELDRLLASGILTIATTLILRLLQPKARIRFYILADSVFLIPLPNNPNFLMRTRSIRVENMGRSKADNVELHFAFEPENFKLIPTMNYTTTITPQKSCVITVPSLGPKEGFWLESITANMHPNLTNVRSDAGAGQLTPVRVNMIFPKWIIAILWFWVLLGMATMFYLLLLLLQFLTHH